MDAVICVVIEILTHQTSWKVTKTKLNYIITWSPSVNWTMSDSVTCADGSCFLRESSLKSWSGGLTVVAIFFGMNRIANNVPLIVHPQAYQRRSEISPLAACEKFTQRLRWKMGAGSPHPNGVWMGLLMAQAATQGVDLLISSDTALLDQITSQYLYAQPIIHNATAIRSNYELSV